MAAPYIAQMELDGFKVTSIVLDKEEFNENIDSLNDVFNMGVENPERVTLDQLELIKQAEHLPLCSRGTKTQHLFEKYNVEGQYLAMIVRGKSKKLLKEMMG